MSIYQYRYLDRVPDWAVTNESIELAKQLGNPGTRRFVTGVCMPFCVRGWGMLTPSRIQSSGVQSSSVCRNGWLMN